MTEVTIPELTRRVEAVEENIKELYGKTNKTDHDLVAVTTTMNSIMETLGELKAAVESLKSRPATLWDKLIAALIGGLVTGFITYMLTR